MPGFTALMPYVHLETAQADEEQTQEAPWDFNSDGIVNYLDLGLLADHWLLTDESPNWDPRFNLSDVAEAGHQIINYLDLGIFADHWLETVP